MVKRWDFHPGAMGSIKYQQMGSNLNPSSDINRHKEEPRQGKEQAMEGTASPHPEPQCLSSSASHLAHLVVFSRLTLAAVGPLGLRLA